ncbi:hypothetical protein [Streptomyces sp. NBC_00425]|uniref:hypothetical protein n=1 Tax=Streptomyces sp. NBC_00425 TaxID=2975740 RepID=UPI003250725C
MSVETVSRYALQSVGNACIISRDAHEVTDVGLNGSQKSPGQSRFLGSSSFMQTPRASQGDAARALADDLRTQIDDLRTRLGEAEMHLEHLTITRKTVTGLADRLTAVAPDLPEHPDYPRILAAFNHASGPLRAKDVCEALGHELLSKNVEGTRATSPYDPPTEGVRPQGDTAGDDAASLGGGNQAPVSAPSGRPTNRSFCIRG